MLNITAKNIQSIIDVTKEDECMTLKEIAKKSGLSSTLVSKCMRRIKDNVVSSKPYIIDCDKAEDTIYIKKMMISVKTLLENREMFLFQTKYLEKILDLTQTEVQAAKAYAQYYIAEEIKQKEAEQQ